MSYFIDSEGSLWDNLQFSPKQILCNGPLRMVKGGRRSHLYLLSVSGDLIQYNRYSGTTTLLLSGLTEITDFIVIKGGKGFLLLYHNKRLTFFDAETRQTSYLAKPIGDAPVLSISQCYLEEKVIMVITDGDSGIVSCLKISRTKDGVFSHTITKICDRGDIIDAHGVRINLFEQDVMFLLTSEGTLTSGCYNFELEPDEAFVEFGKHALVIDDVRDFTIVSDHSYDERCYLCILDHQGHVYLDSNFGRMLSRYVTSREEIGQFPTEISLIAIGGLPAIVKLPARWNSGLTFLDIDGTLWSFRYGQRGPQPTANVSSMINRVPLDQERFLNPKNARKL